MARERWLRGLTIALDGQLARLLERRARAPRDYLIVPAVAGVTVLLVEEHFADFGHGTHLLLYLVIVISAAVRFGPTPAVGALVIGAIGSMGTWLLGLGPPDPVQVAIAQVTIYLFAGTAFLVVMLAAQRGNQRGRWSTAPAAAQPTLVEPLTERESDILRLVAAGMTTEEISSRLFLSRNTVKTHLTHAYGKLGVHNRSQAVRAALHCGCLTSADICPHHRGEPTADPPKG